MRAWLGIVLLCVGSALITVACTAPLTEIVVVVDTTLTVPAQIDEVEIRVDASDVGGGVQSSRVDMTRNRPAALGVVHRGGLLGPILITAVGRRSGGEVVSRRARVSFVSGRAMLLRLDLDAACVARDCGEAMTCGLGGECRSLDHRLEEWPGSALRLDASVGVDGDMVDAGGDAAPTDGAVDAGELDAGPCVPSGAEVCDTVDNDCDMLVDEDTDFVSDALNCGACGNVCAGTCELRACSDARVALAAGRAHTCALGSTGSVYCWGENGFGQLGVGDTMMRTTPAVVTGLTGVVALAAGADHTCSLTSAGQVSCWGQNTSGQLGDGSRTPRPSPVPVTLPPGGARVIAGGVAHTCAIAVTDGTVYCWGANDHMQLGAGLGSARPDPTAVVGLPAGPAEHVATGRGHTCAALSSGAVYCWGDNSSSAATGGGISGDVAPTLIPGADGATSVASGDQHSCALLVDRTARCWGGNGRGQLGLGAANFMTPRPPMPVADLDDAIQLSAGALHTCVVRADGRGACFGDNVALQLADPMLIRSGAALEVTGETDLSRIALGAQHSCARRAGGDVSCWGTAILGDGSSTRSAVPVVVTVP